MGTVRYTTINGQIHSETRNGVRKCYVPDPQGNVVAMTDGVTGAITDTFKYMPYGEVRERTGTTPTRFQYVGTAGYYRTGPSQCYVRSRTLDVRHGQWMTVDPLLNEAFEQYRYAGNSPLVLVDPTGLYAQATKKRVRSGYGQGACPGADAIGFIASVFSRKPNCKKAFETWCPAGLTKTLDGVTLNICKCSPGQDACTCVEIAPDGRGCKPMHICFTEGLCGRDARTRGAALLWELVNWCVCKNRGADPDERTVSGVFNICGLTHIGGKGGALRRTPR